MPIITNSNFPHILQMFKVHPPPPRLHDICRDSSLTHSIHFVTLSIVITCSIHPFHEFLIFLVVVVKKTPKNYPPILMCPQERYHKALTFHEGIFLNSPITAIWRFIVSVLMNVNVLIRKYPFFLYSSKSVLHCYNR